MRAVRDAMWKGIGIATIVAAAASPAAGQGTRLKSVDPFLMDRTKEIALARSAGPNGIGDKASVLVLTRKGYEQASEGTNGFTCFVGRGWSGPGLVVNREGRRVAGSDALNPAILAPHCFNPAASETILAWHLLITNTLIGGSSVESVPDITGLALEQGTLRAPAPQSFAYMTSHGQFLGDNVGRWRPHVMLYVPYASDAVWGSSGLDPNFPFVTNDGTPWSVVIIPLARFSNGENS